MTTTLPQRRSLRLRGYDYSGSGAYFVTICTQDRAALFGEIVDGEMRLNAAGQMVLEIWESLPERYPGWDIDVCVVMPDHFHGILFRQDRLDEKFEITRRGTPCGCPNAGKAGQAQGLAMPGRHKTRPYGGKQSGFTLIELIVVIVIVGILSALGGQFIVAPVTGYVDLSRRAKLVDQAEMAMRRMQRDIRHALPNSIRVTGNYIEMLLTEDGGRYRRYPDPGSGGDILDFSVVDTSFDVLGSLSRQPTAGQQLIVYNVTTAGPSGNAYAAVADNRASIAGTSTTDRIDLSPAFQFANASPSQRFFVVDGPVTYACESNQLNRYDGYTISPAQPTSGMGTAALVTRGISDCEFTYDPGATQRAGLVTMRLTLEEQGETITLLHQVHVVNAP